MAIEDKQYLQLFDNLAKELEQVVVVFNERANGVTDRDQLLAIRREQNNTMAEVVHQHKRALDFFEGLPVEPMTHFAECTLEAVMGGGPTF